MAYDFKRLADVEELSEAPENAKALIEVDGDIKRAPAGGGGNAILEDLIFDLDFSVAANGINFVNMEQVKRAYDNNMNIYAVSTSDPSGVRYSTKASFYNIKDTMAVQEASGGTVVGLTVNSGGGKLIINIDSNEYENSELIVPTNAYVVCTTSSSTFVKVYASIF